MPGTCTDSGWYVLPFSSPWLRVRCGLGVSSAGRGERWREKGEEEKGMKEKRKEGKLEMCIFSHRKTTVHTETNPKS